jgi:hypothetical protein
MTEDNMKEIAAKQRELFAENKFARQKSTITFLGGHVDGERMKIPNGVNEMTVESAFGPVRYVRSEINSQQFIPA